MLVAVVTTKAYGVVDRATALAGTHPVLPFGRCASCTCTQSPCWATTRKTSGAPDACGFGRVSATAPPGSALTGTSVPRTAATVEAAGAITGAIGSSTASGAAVGAASGVAVTDGDGDGADAAGARPNAKTHATMIAAHTTTAAATMKIVRRRGTFEKSGTDYQPA